MTNEGSRTAALSPSPRHMRKRRFKGDVPAALLPSHQPAVKAAGKAPSAAVTAEGANPSALEPRFEDQGPLEQPQKARRLEAEAALLRRKRLIALALVILVSVSIPALAFALMFAR